MSIVILLPRKRMFRFLGIIAITAFLFYLLLPSIQFLINYTIRFVQGQHPLGGYTVYRSPSVPLPSIAVESGQTLCCRMEFCDYRFPLPKGARVEYSDGVKGGFDTIYGTIYVTNTDGGTVDLHAYAKLVHEAGFCVSFNDDLPGFEADSPDGGGIEVQDGQSTRIKFSFFGDY